MIPYIEDINKENVALYLNFPFCVSPCSYCHYVDNIKFGVDNVSEDYFEKICNQLQEICFYLQKVHLKSIYFGGGTPSLLSDLQLNRIHEIIHENEISFDEVSIELHPGVCNFDYSNNEFITRYSIAVQSFDNEILLDYHRKGYDIANVESLIQTLRKNKTCQLINIDLVFDEVLPESTFSFIDKIRPDSVTIYPNTKGRGVIRLKNIKETFFKIAEKLKGYIPLANSEFIYLLLESNQSEYSKIECETFGDIIGLGHNSVSLIKDSSFLTLYEKEKISIKKRVNRGSRYMTSFLSSLPIGVTYKSVQSFLPELQRGHYLLTVKGKQDVNEKHTMLNANDLVYLPQQEYIRFIDKILLPLYGEYAITFLSTIGFGDDDITTIRTVYNDYLIIPHKEEMELREIIHSKEKILTKLEIPDCLILVEGIDGSGKDTFVRFLDDEFKKRFKYSKERSISILGQPDSHLPGGKDAKRFIEDLVYSDKHEVRQALYTNRIQFERKIQNLPGICLVVRGIGTDRATYNFAFKNNTDTLGENIVIKSWDYYIVINVDTEIANDRIEKRGIPRTWREAPEYLSYFSDYFLNYDSEMFKKKLIIENTSFIYLREQVRKLANEIYATEYRKIKR